MLSSEQNVQECNAIGLIVVLQPGQLPFDKLRVTTNYHLATILKLINLGVNRLGNK